MNPLLQPFTAPYEAPPFDQIREEHFTPAIEELIRVTEAEIRLIAENPDVPDFDNTIVALEAAGERLNVASNILFNLNHAETNERLQQVAQEVSPLLTGFSNRMMMNETLFGRVKELYLKAEGRGQRAKGEIEGRGQMAEEGRVLENWYLDFVRNGALLQGADKQRFAEIKTRLATLTLEFADHVLAETNDFFMHLTGEDELAGLPEYVREGAAGEASSRNLEGWVFTLHATSFVPFMKHADRRDLRERLFKAFSFRANRNNEHDNKARMAEIVNLRLEMARLLGDEHYAAYRLKTKMAERSERVMQFLDELYRAAYPAAKREFDEVSGYARSKGTDFELQAWDWSYWAEKLKESKYGFREEMLKPYFELSRVIRGVFMLADRLFGIRFVEAGGYPVYHPDVKVYEVLDSDGSFLALFYADFHPRKGKQGGAWMTDFRMQSCLRGRMVRPHVSIVCNFSKPTGDKPSLLTVDEVNTFLHEFGHALHGMLSQVTFPSVAGTNVYQDFVELPSQIMENWMVEKEWLDLFAEHYETGAKIPQELLDRMVDARNFLEGYATVRQLGFGFSDMAWHSLTEPFDGDVIEFERSATEKVRLFPRIEGAGFGPAFTHIFAGGYAAGYYGYKWAEVLDADAFSLFSERGIFNREVADSYRKNILERGGSEHPMELYRRFRGQEPTIDALLRRSALIEPEEH